MTEVVRHLEENGHAINADFVSNLCEVVHNQDLKIDHLAEEIDRWKGLTEELSRLKAVEISPDEIRGASCSSLTYASKFGRITKEETWSEAVEHLRATAAGVVQENCDLAQRNERLELILASFLARIDQKPEAISRDSTVRVWPDGSECTDYDLDILRELSARGQEFVEDDKVRKMEDPSHEKF